MKLKGKDIQISEFYDLNSNHIKIFKSKRKNKILIFIIIIIFLNILSLFIILILLFEFKRKFNNKFLETINNEKHHEIMKKQLIIEDKLNKIKAIQKNNDNYIQYKLNLIENYKNKNILNQTKASNFNFIFPLKVIGLNKIRIGKNGDGGYILLEDLKQIKIAYSFGIGAEISFEKYLAEKNIDIFMYDHTIKKLPVQNSKFHWQKIGLKGNISKENMFKTLPELIRENGHSNEQNMILKIDIENSEWEVFQSLPINILKQFKYIVGEFHFSSSSKKYNYFNILRKLLSTHQIFHLHCNNCGKIIKLEESEICNLLEISFLLKKDYKFEQDNNIYPQEGLDYKNCYYKKDNSFLINYLKNF